MDSAGNCLSATSCAISFSSVSTAAAYFSGARTSAWPQALPTKSTPNTIATSVRRFSKNCMVCSPGLLAQIFDHGGLISFLQATRHGTGFTAAYLLLVNSDDGQHLG